MGHRKTELGGALPSLVCSATLGVHLQGARGQSWCEPRCPVGPAQRGTAGLSEPRRGKAGGGHRALPQEQRVLSLAGSHGRQSRGCTRAASDIITILIMKGQLLQSSPSPRRRERRMQRSCVSLIPSSRGESAAVPGWSLLVLHQATDPQGQNPARVPAGCSPRWEFGAVGVPA